MTSIHECAFSLCWGQWRSSPLSKNGSLTFKQFLQTCSIDQKNTKVCRDGKKMFELLDSDKDHKVEFPDLMIFLFSLDETLSPDQSLRRSFHLYDRNRRVRIWIVVKPARHTVSFTWRDQYYITYHESECHRDQKPTSAYSVCYNFRIHWGSRGILCPGINILLLL